MICMKVLVTDSKLDDTNNQLTKIVVAALSLNIYSLQIFSFFVNVLIAMRCNS